MRARARTTYCAYPSTHLNKHTRACARALTLRHLQLAASAGATQVYCHGEATAGERHVEAAVAQALQERGAELKVGLAYFACQTLL